MPTVRVKENEPFEVALRRFKRTGEKTGLLTELRAREYYEKPTQERKRKLAAAIKRNFKRHSSQQMTQKLYSAATKRKLSAINRQRAPTSSARRRFCLC